MMGVPPLEIAVQAVNRPDFFDWGYVSLRW